MSARLAQEDAGTAPINVLSGRRSRSLTLQSCNTSRWHLSRAYQTRFRFSSDNFKRTGLKKLRT